MKKFTKGLIMSKNVPAIPTAEEFKTYQQIALSASKTPYWNKLGGEAGVLSIMLLARELGISPMNAISGMFHVVLGKVEISAKGITYLIRKHGHQLKLIMLTPTKCIIQGKRSDTGEEMEVTYTFEDAQKAGLVKSGGGWINNPKDMLFARTVSRLGRWLFTDCLGTCYVEGELQESIEKKVMEKAPEVDLQEIEIATLPIDLPKDVKQEEVDNYLEYLSEEYDRPKTEFLYEAQKRPDTFFAKVKEYSEATREASVLLANQG